MTLTQLFPPPRQFTSSLKLTATNYAFRCDAKFADSDFLQLEARVRGGGCFQLGAFLPDPFVRGVQPVYLDQPTEDSVPVINTLSIQRLTIALNDCRHMSRDDFDLLTPERRLRDSDVLLTVDGGASIGKPALFRAREDQDFTVDSHVCILRPSNLSPLALVYLLASPFGQMQFRRAESGASGQTTVTEDDIRRFIFPTTALKSINQIAKKIEAERLKIASQREALDAKEVTLWQRLEMLVK